MIVVVCVACQKPFSFIENEEAKKHERAGLCQKCSEEDHEYQRKKRNRPAPKEGK